MRRSKGKISKYRQVMRDYVSSRIAKWAHGCLWVIVLHYCLTDNTSLFANSAAQTEEITLVTQEIHYHRPEASQVFLLWGINGWDVVPLEKRPKGTIVKDNLMHTPMAHTGDTFTVKLQVPANTTINYGFLITRKLRIAYTGGNWDGDYHVTPSKDDVIKMNTSLLKAQIRSFIKRFNLWRCLLTVTVIGLTIWLSYKFLNLLSRPVKRRVLIIGVYVLPFVVFFFIGESYLRIRGYPQYVRTFPGQFENDPGGVEWAEHDPFLGWVTNKKVDWSEANQQGFRDTKDFSKINLYSEKIRVMILGDSFMWGAGVTLNENVPNLLQSKLQDRYEFFNISVPGWGIDQMYLAYEKYRKIIEPDIIILAFIDDDVKRVLEAYRIWERMNKPSFAVKNDSLIPRTSVSESQMVFNKFVRKSRLFGLFMEKFYLMKYARPVVKKIFLTIAKETQQTNGKFVVIRIPTQDYNNSVTNVNARIYNFENIFKGTGVVYLDPSGEITQIPNWSVDFYLDDGHMSVAGNQCLADYIFRNVFENSNIKRN